MSGDDGYIEGTTTSVNGSRTTWQGDLHDDGNGRTMSGEMTGSERRNGSRSKGHAHVTYDKVVGEIVEIDPLNDPTADS